MHVLADTLGSVFVIISTILMQSFGWKWVDPFCSLILSMLILTSVIPLLKASMATLMQNIPPELEEDFDHTLNNVSSTFFSILPISFYYFGSFKRLSNFKF